MRSAVLDDAAALIDHSTSVLLESTFLISQSDELTLTEEQRQDWIRQHAASPTSLLLVAEVDGAIVGMLNFACGERRRLAHRGTLGVSVRKDHQSIGVGSALLETLIEWSEAHPAVEKLCLAVVETNGPAIQLYQKFGFAEEGRRQREVKLGPGQYLDDILMYRFVDVAK
ncbi:MAG: GNAT family N-acetyltransferase [Planctomycetaceae bacterium]